MVNTLRAPLVAALLLSAAACGDDTTGSGGAPGSGGAGPGGGSTSGDPATTSGSSTSGSSTSSSTAETSSGSGGDGGNGTGGEGGTGTVTSTTQASSSGNGGGAACAGEGFTAVSEDAGDLGDVFLYFALSAEAAPQDDLSIEIYSNIGTSGDRIILDENYSVCDPCVLLRLGCDENFDNCSQRFLANSGTIAIESFEGTFTGQLEGVELIEVTIGEGAVSTPVPGGDVWCLDGYAFQAEIQ